MIAQIKKVVFMDIVQNILNIAKQRNYTNKQLCVLLGKNSSYISDWKSGKSKPKADELVLLAKEFNVTIDHLIGNSTDYILPSGISDKQSTIIELTNQLTEEELEEIIKYAKLLKRGRK